MREKRWGGVWVDLATNFSKFWARPFKTRVFALAAFSILLCGIFLAYKFATRNKPEQPIPAILSEHPSPVPTMMLADDYIYRQDDSRWGHETIGETTDTMSAYGCTISSVALAASNLTQTEITPSMLQSRLSDAGGFTSRGWLIWDKVSEATDGKITAKYFDNPSHTDIEACIAEGNYPVIKIKLYDSIIHWVAIVGTTEDQYLIRDPLVGTANDAPIELSDRSEDILGVRCIARI